MESKPEELVKSLKQIFDKIYTIEDVKLALESIIKLTEEAKLILEHTSNSNIVIYPDQHFEGN